MGLNNNQVKAGVFWGMGFCSWAINTYPDSPIASIVKDRELLKQESDHYKVGRSESTLWGNPIHKNPKNRAK